MAATIRSAPSTWRRPSPTAPTTSWSGGRYATRKTREPLPKRSRRPSPASSSNKLLEQPLQMLVVRQHHAVEERLAAAAHEDGRKVLDVDVLDGFGVVLDVDPAEFRARETLGHRQEPGTVGDAGIAPRGAKAGDEKFAIRLHAWPILCTRWPEWQACSRSRGQRARTAARCRGGRCSWVSAFCCSARCCSSRSRSSKTGS